MNANSQKFLTLSTQPEHKETPYFDDIDSPKFENNLDNETIREFQNATIVLKEKVPSLDGFRFYSVNSQNVIEKVCPSYKLSHELNNFIENHYESYNCEEILQPIPIEMFEFKRKNGIIYFREIETLIQDDECWNTIIVAHESIVNKMVKKEYPLTNYGDGTWIHGINPNFFEEEHMRVKRSISTYGKIEHIPQVSRFDFYTKKFSTSTQYIVVDISHIIPNEKPYRGTVNNVHLHVEPINGLDDDEEIFWFVDYTNKTICQFEDGANIIDLESIEIV